MSDQPKHLIDRLREIEGYENASKVAYDLLFEAMEDIDSTTAIKVRRVAPNIKRIRSYKILNNTNRDTLENTRRLLKSLLRNSPFKEEIQNVEGMDYRQIEDTFVKASEYWISELYQMKN